MQSCFLPSKMWNAFLANVMINALLGRVKLKCLSSLLFALINSIPLVLDAQEAIGKCGLASFVWSWWARQHYTYGGMKVSWWEWFWSMLCMLVSNQGRSLWILWKVIVKLIKFAHWFRIKPANSWLIIRIMLCALTALQDYNLNLVLPRTLSCLVSVLPF